MSIRTPLCDEFGIEAPVFAFSPWREVVVEVSKAGGMGVLGAIQYAAEELAEHLAWIDAHVGGNPYGVDIVMPASYVGAGEMDLDVLMKRLEESISQEHRAYVEKILSEHGVPPLPEDEQGKMRRLLSWTDATTRPQLDVAFRHPIRLIANALGAPPEDVIARAHSHGVKVAALAGSSKHALAHAEAGVDIVVAQGTEAGGHTGDVTSMVLWPEIIDAVAPRPVLAAGGIGDGRQMAAALALGAQGVWTGSIWLTTIESDLPKAAKQKLLEAGSRDTVRSRALTGKPARQLRTAWTDAWDDPKGPGALPMPLQFMLTADAIRRIHLAENRELIGSPVGQIVGRMNEERPVAAVFRDLVAECEATIARLRGLAGA